MTVHIFRMSGLALAAGTDTGTPGRYVLVHEDARGHRDMLITRFATGQVHADWGHGRSDVFDHVDDVVGVLAASPLPRRTLVGETGTLLGLAELRSGARGTVYPGVDDTFAPQAFAVTGDVACLRGPGGLGDVRSVHETGRTWRTDLPAGPAFGAHLRWVQASLAWARTRDA